MPGITSVDHRRKGEPVSRDFDGAETVELLDTMPRTGVSLLQNGCLRCRETFDPVVEEGTLHETHRQPCMLAAQMSNEMFLAASRVRH